MPKIRELCDDERLQVITEINNGKSYREIAKIHKITIGGISKLKKKVDSFGTLKNLPRGHRPKATSQREDNQIKREALKKKFISAKQVKKNLNLNVHVTTIRKRLRENGIHGRIARRTPFLTDDNKRYRYEFAVKYHKMPLTFWNRVIWTDESKFEIIGSKRRKYV